MTTSKNFLNIASLPSSNRLTFLEQKEIYIRYLSSEESTQLAQAEITDRFEDLFKTYYKATTIEARKNPRLQNSWMPKRYYKHLTEID